MQMQNFSHNTGDQSDRDKSRSRNDIQREIMMQESELRKKLNEKILIEAEIRKFKKEIARIRVELQQKQDGFSKMDYEILQIEESIKSLKKKLYLIK